jgi:hypothetical protein
MGTFSLYHQLSPPLWQGMCCYMYVPDSNASSVPLHRYVHKSVEKSYTGVQVEEEAEDVLKRKFLRVAYTA